MTRLLVGVEGPTEENFVNEILGPHLYGLGYHAVSTRIMGNARQRERRGGITSWETARREILRHLKEDQDRIVTTMVDYYGLPDSGSQAWPGRAPSRSHPIEHRASMVENAVLADVADQLGDRFNPAKFVPYLNMHEFEALLFSDCSRFAKGINQPELEEDLQRIRDAFNNPEHIDDSPETAPSKRIIKLIPRYQKPIMGIDAVREIGLDLIRQECPHFDQWLSTLENVVLTPDRQTVVDLRGG